MPRQAKEDFIKLACGCAWWFYCLYYEMCIVVHQDMQGTKRGSYNRGECWGNAPAGSCRCIHTAFDES